MINVGFQSSPSQTIDLWRQPAFVFAAEFFWIGINHHYQTKSNISGGSARICVCVCVVFYLASVWTVGERWLGRVWFMKSSSSYPSRNEASCLYGILLAWHGTARHWARQSVIRAGQRVPRWVSDLETLLFKWPPVEIVSHTTETQCLCVHGSSSIPILNILLWRQTLWFTILRVRVTNNRRASSQLYHHHQQPNIAFLNVTDPYRKTVPLINACSLTHYINMLRAVKPSFAFDMQSICRMVSVGSRAKRASHGDDSLGVQGTQTDVRLQQQSSGTRPFCRTWWLTAVQGDPQQSTQHTRTYMSWSRVRSLISLSAPPHSVPDQSEALQKKTHEIRCHFYLPFLLCVCVCLCV